MLAKEAVRVGKGAREESPSTIPKANAPTMPPTKRAESARYHVLCDRTPPTEADATEKVALPAHGVARPRNAPIPAIATKMANKTIASLR